MKWLVVIPAIALAGCAVLPNPTQINDVGSDVWVEWENHSEELYRVTLTGEGGSGWGLVEPCTASGMGMQMAGPFVVGVASADSPESDRGQPVADSTAVQNAMPGFLVVVIDENGRTTVETRDQQRSEQGICP